MVEITLREYNSLVEDSLMLEALNGAGVDNWQGYDFAMETFREMVGEEDED